MVDFRRLRQLTCRILGQGLLVGVMLNVAPAFADAELAKQAQEAVQRGDLKAAVRLWTDAVNSYIKRPGPRHPTTLAALTNLASVHGSLGNVADQLALNEALVRLRTQAQGEKHPDTLLAMANLATSMGSSGRLKEEVELHEKVLASRREVLGESHPTTLTSMASLATAYGNVGRVTEQLLLNEKVLGLRTQSLGPRHPDTLTSMNNLAATLGRMGRLADQLSLQEKVLSLRTEILGEKHPDTLSAMGNLAAIYGRLGRLDEQLLLQQKVLALRTQVLGARHPNTLITMSNVASALGALDMHGEELALNEKVLMLRSETLGETHPSTLNSMGNLASTLGTLGRVEEQLALNEKLVKLRTQQLGEKHPDTLTTLNNLAATYARLGRTEEEVALNERVLTLLSETLGERHPTTLNSIENLAQSYRRARRSVDELALSSKYVAGVEWQRSQPGLSAENRQSIFRRYALGYRNFAALHGARGNMATGFELAERGKARTLLEGMTLQRAVRSGALPIAEQERLDDLNRQIGILQQRKAQGGGQAQAWQGLETELNQLTLKFTQLQSELQARYPKYAQLSDVRILDSSQLAGLIPSQSVAVSFIHSRDRLSAFVVNGKSEIRFVDLGQMPYLGDAIEALRNIQSLGDTWLEQFKKEGRTLWMLADGSFRFLPLDKAGPPDAKAVQRPQPLLDYLGARLLKPLQPHLRTAKTWIISPDGPLAQLPFETLPWGPKGEPVIQSVEIHYTQSLSVYALGRDLQKDYANLRGRKTLFAMGNPIYERQGVAMVPKARALSRQTRWVAGQRLEDLDDRWENLPGTEVEVKAVASLFPESSAVYLGPQATEHQLQKLNQSGELRNYRYLLFSVHGYLSPDSPSLSSLVLGLVNKEPGTDGYVTASEWPGYDLRSDLAVLSACDSGLGKVVSGEGVMGLPFAMFVAGNVNTLMTLWPVDDEATAEFVSKLFGHLKAGATPAQGLAQTKREFLNHKQFSDPRFWAPFILVGPG